MNNPRQILAAIAALPLEAPVRILNLSGDQERVISLSGMRHALPDRVRLLSGPGCAAAICPQPDLYQAISLAERLPVTLLAAENMLRLPLGRHLPGPHSLLEAADKGADVRMVSAPIEAVVVARAEPWREMVLFVAGFETLLAPLAGLILEDWPKNLSILFCGRTVEPLLLQMLQREERGFDALILPGNRCAVTGIQFWEEIAATQRLPSVVAGYTFINLLAAIHSVLIQHLQGEARLDNCYKSLVRPGGSVMTRDQLDRVFERVEGAWRGVGRVGGSAFRLRHAYQVFDADRRFTDFRPELADDVVEMPAGCECAGVVLGIKDPTECPLFDTGCRAAMPYGPCMASQDGACHLRAGVSWAA